MTEQEVDRVKNTCDSVLLFHVEAIKSRDFYNSVLRLIYDRIDHNKTIVEQKQKIDRLNELLKEQQPRVLTLKETINTKYPTDVFCEIKGEERIFAVTAPVQAQWIGKPDIRYWTARPTEEQRKAEPWKDGDGE